MSSNDFPDLPNTRVGPAHRGGVTYGLWRTVFEYNIKRKKYLRAITELDSNVYSLYQAVKTAATRVNLINYRLPEGTPVVGQPPSPPPIQQIEEKQRVEHFLRTGRRLYTEVRPGESPPANNIDVIQVINMTYRQLTSLMARMRGMNQIRQGLAIKMDDMSYTLTTELLDGLLDIEKNMDESGAAVELDRRYGHNEEYAFATFYDTPPKQVWLAVHMGAMFPFKNGESSRTRPGGSFLPYLPADHLDPKWQGYEDEYLKLRRQENMCNLARYGAYSPVNCLYLALEVLSQEKGNSKGVFKFVKEYGERVDQIHLRKIAETAGIEIRLHVPVKGKMSGNKSNTILINKLQDTHDGKLVYHIARAYEHYFIYENAILTKVLDPDRQHGFNYRKPFVTSLNLITYLIETQRIVPMNNNFLGHLLGESEIVGEEKTAGISPEDICSNNVTPKPKQKKKNNCYKKACDIAAIDFEATTDEDKHKPFFGGVCLNDMPVQMYRSNFVKQIIHYLTTNATVYDCGNSYCYHCNNGGYKKIKIYAHNLRYDLSFIVHKLGFQDYIGSNTSCKGFISRKWGVELEFHDSCSIIPMKLEKFAETFNLPNYKKGICPYNAYNQDTVDLDSIPLAYALTGFHKAITQKTRQEFILAANDGYLSPGMGRTIDLKDESTWYTTEEISEQTFSHMAYNHDYCVQDIEVLRAGLKAMEKMVKKEIDMDIKEEWTIPGLAQNYFKKSGVFDGVKGVRRQLRRYLTRQCHGGKTMLGNNEMRVIEGGYIVNIDGRSLYPSAMEEMGGLLKGEAKLIPEEWLTPKDGYKKLREQDGYFIDIQILNVPTYLQLPLIRYLDKKGVCQYRNTYRGRMEVCKPILEGLEEHHDMEPGIDFIILPGGCYYDEGRNDSLVEAIQHLYATRRDYKKMEPVNPAEIIYKLLMNAGYGKMMQRVFDKKCKYVADRKEASKVVAYDGTHVISVRDVDDGGCIVETRKPNQDYYNYAHCAAEILGVSKIIMARVTTLADQLGIAIYYTDTDSIHMDGTNVEGLEDAFEKKYGKKLMGSDLGQFHCDFEVNDPELDPNYDLHATYAVYLGKKSYYELVPYLTKSGELRYFHNVKLKGVPRGAVDAAANEIGKDDHMKYFALYSYMYLGNPVDFDLLEDVCPRFIKNTDYTMSSKKEFVRQLKFTDPSDPDDITTDFDAGYVRQKLERVIDPIGKPTTWDLGIEDMELYVDASGKIIAVPMPKRTCAPRPVRLLSHLPIAKPDGGIVLVRI